MRKFRIASVGLVPGAENPCAQAELFEPGTHAAAEPALYPRTPDIERSPEHGHNNAAKPGAGPGTGVFSATAILRRSRGGRKGYVL